MPRPNHTSDQSWISQVGCRGLQPEAGRPLKADLREGVAPMLANKSLENPESEDQQQAARGALRKPLSSWPGKW